MGSMTSWNGTDTAGTGYLAVPESGGGPGVIVIQEWWGLVPHITDVCDRYAAEGFVALAPDLYDGVATTEPDEAGKLMMTLNLGAAVERMSGAVDHLRSLEAVTSPGVGVTGFCMGGGLALLLACRRPDAVVACAPYYGVIPWPDAEPDWSALSAEVSGHFAANDASFPPERVADLEARLTGLAKTVSLEVHPDTDHAFFNDTRPEVYDAEASAVAWADTVAFFRRTLG
jgi:carboxymethylenebutenolidase